MERPGVGCSAGDGEKRSVYTYRLKCFRSEGFLILEALGLDIDAIVIPD